MRTTTYEEDEAKFAEHGLGAMMVRHVILPQMSDEHIAKLRREGQEKATAGDPDPRQQKANLLLNDLLESEIYRRLGLALGEDDLATAKEGRSRRPGPGKARCQRAAERADQDRDRPAAGAHR